MRTPDQVCAHCGEWPCVNKRVRIIAQPRSALAQVEQLAPRSRTTTTTTKLPRDWRPVVIPQPSGPAQPAPSKAMRDASREATIPMPAIGRAGTRERVRAGDVVFGGSEVR